MPRSPVLDVADVVRALEAHGFTWKRTKGAHQHYEGYTDGVRRVVTVDANDAPFSGSNRSLKSIIRNSGIAKAAFYEAAGKPLVTKRRQPDPAQGS